VRPPPERHSSRTDNYRYFLISFRFRWSAGPDLSPSMPTIRSEQSLADANAFSVPITQMNGFWALPVNL
jgi:hypothetical protein